MSEVARSHRSDLRAEPFGSPPGAERSNATGDPLAELARLVGQDDPFRALFRQGKAPANRVAEPTVPLPSRGNETAEAAYHDAGVAEAPFSAVSDHMAEEPGVLGLRPSHHEDQDRASVDGHAEPWHEAHDQPDFDHQPSEGDDGRHGSLGDLPVSAEHYVAPPLTPDLWAYHGGGDEDSQVAAPALSDETPTDGKASRRPLVVLAAVLALTGGGLAATFLSRSGSSAIVYASGGAPPTIMAATGPTKIKQSDNSADTTPEDADAALLNKNGASSGGPVKVVNSQEQPIDLAQLPKSSIAANDAGSAASSPFPAPKKVKTFLVRPDGSLVNGPAASGAAASAMPQLAAGGFPGGNGADAALATTSSTRSTTPTGGSHGATTPKAPPTSIADALGVDTPEGGAPKVKQPAGGRPAVVAKPVEVADASAAETTATTGQGGNFGLQLAASPSEQDARAAFAKLQKKYSELGGYQPTVKKVDNGQKTVYRLRVSNLSQDQAKTLCSQLQASGGSCFVVRSN